LTTEKTYSNICGETKRIEIQFLSNKYSNYLEVAFSMKFTVFYSDNSEPRCIFSAYYLYDSDTAKISYLNKVANYLAVNNWDQTIEHLLFLVNPEKYVYYLDTNNFEPVNLHGSNLYYIYYQDQHEKEKVYSSCLAFSEKEARKLCEKYNKFPSYSDYSIIIEREKVNLLEKVMNIEY